LLILHIFFVKLISSHHSSQHFDPILPVDLFGRCAWESVTSPSEALASGVGGPIL